MTNRRSSRREFLGLTGAGLAGLTSASWLRAADTQNPDLVVFNAKVYTVDSRAEGGGVRGKGRPLHRGREQRGDPRRLSARARRRSTPEQMTIVPGLHRLPQSRDRQHAALRRAGRQSLRGGVRHHRQHRRQASREGSRDAAGHLGGGVFLRRHQGEGQSRAERSRPGSGVEGSSGGGASSRRPHIVLQQQGARDGGHQQEHAQSAGRDLRPRRQRRPQRPRHRPRDERAQPGGQAAGVYRSSSGSSATAMGWRTSPSSSCAMA